MPTLAEIMGGLLHKSEAPTPAPTGLAGILAQQQPRGLLDSSWYRPDGAQKGMGYFGALPSADGRTSTELSIGVDGRDIPSLVPSLTPAEVNHMLLGNAPTREIVQKALAHALMRQRGGQSPFAGESDLPVQWGVPWRKP
jgi:hypothetical protein